MRGIGIRIVIAFVAVTLAPCFETGADTLRGRFRLSLKALVNPVQGPPSVLCQASAETGPHQKIAWWIAFGEAKEPPGERGPGTRDPALGGCGVGEPAGADPETAYLLAKVLTSARPIREGPVALEVSLSLSRFSTFQSTEEPVYQESVATRDFILSPDAPDAFIPLLVAGPEERQALGVREVIVKLEAEIVGEPAGPYGLVRVVSDMAGADLLLDGGVIGKIAEGADTLLPHVPVGLRELRAREPSGNRVHRVVRVLPGRTVVVELSRGGSEEKTSPYALVSLGENPQGYREYRRERDAAAVVNIPSGEFVMGNPETERQPLEHTVYVSEFLIDKMAVTWRQYKRFAGATGTTMPPEPFWGMHDDHPVVFVAWEDARDYCEWAGGRLPTEAEREKAARGTDKRMYPWGNEPPDAERAVHRRSWGFEATDPVGAHPSGASPYGVLDIAGNVWEWCMDWYDKDYYSVSPRRDPKGPASGQAHVVRGGSWDSRPDVLSCSCRSFGNLGYREGDFGFRCAMNAPR